MARSLGGEGSPVPAKPALEHGAGSSEAVPGLPAAGDPPRRFGSPLYEFAEVDSTQAIAAGLAAEGAPEGTVVLAEHQREGRGRRGRSWHDHPGDNLLFSLILRPQLIAAHVPRLALLAAVAVAEGVERHTGLRPGIKWPNDILLADRKCAGVLAEATTEGAAVGRVILGIGVNVNQRGFPDDLAPHVTSLALELGTGLDRRALLAEILLALERWCAIHTAHGFALVHAEWCRRSVTLGRAVVVGAVRGMAAGLDADGALLVRDAAGGLQRVVVAEVDHAAGR
jgi:BirA family transcriptional regulator, biotin operon repressor / biotin---[acetyl-CoA-carboxylase] ligase